MSRFVQRPEYVYHYCSVETFVSIIQNATIRASNIKKSNDYSEVINSIDLYKDALFNAGRKFIRMHAEAESFKEFFFNIDIDFLVENAINNETCTYYVACFSEAKDLLSQWRGYADDGKGVSIGFLTDYLAKETNSVSLNFRPIYYEPDKIKENLMKDIIQCLERVINSKNQCLVEQGFENAFSSAIGTMVYNSVFMKNKAFLEEKEWRLVYYPFGNIRNLKVGYRTKDLSKNGLYYDRMLDMTNNKNDYNGLIRKQVNFQNRENSIVSYVDFDFKNILPFFIKEIILGPKNDMDDLDLRLFLLSNGLDLSYTDILRSTATYR